MKKWVAAILCFWAVVLPCHGEGYVALTFDDGPSGKFTRRLLTELSEREAKATFFLCGYRLEQYPELAMEIAEQGHELGIHGYSHNKMCTMPEGKTEQEIDKTMALLPKTVPIRLMRPPGGMVSAAVAKCARDRGLSLILWSLDPKDWQIHDASTVKRKVVENARDGDIILLHDMTDSSVDAALGIVDALKAKGFSFVTVSELAEIRQAELTPGEVFRNFLP